MNEIMTVAFKIFAIVAAMCLIVMAVSSARISSRKEPKEEPAIKLSSSIVDEPKEEPAIKLSSSIVDELKKELAQEIRENLSLKAMLEAEESSLKLLEMQITLFRQDNSKLRTEINDLKDLVVIYRSELEKYGYFKLSK